MTSGKADPRGLRDSQFPKLWAAASVSTFGDGVLFTGLPLLAAHLSRDPLQVSVVTSAAFLPWLLVGLAAGAFVDRRDRRRVMWSVDAGRCVVVGGLAIAVASGWASIALLAIGAFALGVGQTLFDSASQSLVPILVSIDEHALNKANGRLIGGQTVSEQFLGPPAGGYLYALGASLPLVIDAVSFAISSALIAAIPGRFSAPRPPDAITTTLRTDIREGLRWLWRHRLLRALAMAVGVINFAITAGDAILVLFAREHLHLGSAGYGLLLSSLAIGGVIGSLVSARLGRRFHISNIIFAALVIEGASWAAFGLTSSPWMAAAMLAISSSAVTIWNVTTVSLRQSIVPDELMGRVVSAFRMVGYGTIPLGAIAGGLVARSVGLRGPFLLGGATMLVLALPTRSVVNRRMIDQARALPA